MAVAGDNPERLRSKASMAALCGTGPLQAAPGKTTRHRLNRGGDRAANNALWTIAMVRMRSDPRTQIYFDRRTREGMSRKEIHRYLKRYLVRELYPLILADLADSSHVSWHRSVNAVAESFFSSLKSGSSKKEFTPQGSKQHLISLTTSKGSTIAYVVTNLCND